MRRTNRSLQQAYKQDYSADHQPPNHPDETPVRPADQRSGGENDHAGIAARNHQPEPGVKGLPGPDIGPPRKGKTPSIARPATYAITTIQHNAFKSKPNTGCIPASDRAPENIPERRMKQVDAMIEKIAEFAGLNGDPGQLAIDSIQKRHDPASQQAGEIDNLCKTGNKPPGSG